MLNWKKSFYIFFSVMLLLMFWQFSCANKPTLFFIIPTPIGVLKKLYLHKHCFLTHGFATLKEMFCGMALAASISFPLASLMARYRAVRAFCQPFFIFLQCLPMFTLAPLMVIWVGWSFTAIVIPTALMVLFPLTINLYKGILATPREYVQFFRLHEASEWQTLIKLKIPFALPHVFAGLRISAAVAGIGAVAGEWAGAQKGLGVFIQECRHDFDLEGVFGALICLVLLTLCFYGLVAFLEKFFCKGARNEI